MPDSDLPPSNACHPTPSKTLCLLYKASLFRVGHVPPEKGTGQKFADPRCLVGLTQELEPVNGVVPEERPDVVRVWRPDEIVATVGSID